RISRTENAGKSRLRSDADLVSPKMLSNVSFSTGCDRESSTILAVSSETPRTKYRPNWPRPSHYLQSI
ncbi:MAG TPA: hypothetical protein VMH37_06015, partial [Candidatus Binataceae bacterium]|nr:hypothetical protein [Candidatus Binataceae bacterium]